MERHEHYANKMIATSPTLLVIGHICLASTLLVDGKHMVCKNKAMGTWGTSVFRCWKPTSFAGKMHRRKTKRETRNHFQQKLNRFNMQFSRRKKLKKIKEPSIKVKSQGTVGWMENKKEQMLAGKEDKRIGRIKIEINMADDGIRKRREGV